MPIENAPSYQGIEVVVHAMSTDGRGIARLDDGRVVFVPLVLPGERVLISEPKKRLGVFEAVAQKRLESHPQRQVPPCPVFGRCGGCQLQHAEDALQNELRVSFLHHNLRRLGGYDAAFLEHAKQVTRSHEALPTFGYRRRLRWHVREKVGFMAPGSNHIVATERCLLGAGPLASSAALARSVAGGKAAEVEITLDAESTLHARPLSGRRGFEATRAKGSAPGGQHFALPHPHLAPFLVHPESFVQPHVEAASLYGNTLEAELVSFLHRANTPQTVRMWDLYCGSGAFSFLPFFLKEQSRGPRCFDVVAVEGIGHAVEACALNYANNTHRFEPGAHHSFRTQAEDVNAFVRHARAPHTPHVVIADPPRDGMGTASLQHLVGLFDQAPSESRLFLYVACDSGSLARDMKPLLQAGFALETLHVFHTFAQSAHFETIAVLTRGALPACAQKETAP